MWTKEQGRILNEMPYHKMRGPRPTAPSPRFSRDLYQTMDGRIVRILRTTPMTSPYLPVMGSRDGTIFLFRSGKVLSLTVVDTCTGERIRMESMNLRPFLAPEGLGDEVDDNFLTDLYEEEGEEDGFEDSTP